MLYCIARIRDLLRGSELSAAGARAPEALEPRTLFATVVWDGGAGGMGTDWHVPANWAGDQVPGVNDDAVLDVGAFVRITQAAVVRSVTSTVTLLIESPAGSLSVSEASSTANLVLNGELTGLGDFTINNFLNWSSGVMRGGGRTILPSTGIATITGTGGTTLARRLINSGEISMDVPIFQLSFGTATGTIQNLSAGRIECFASTAIFSNQPGAAIDNAGTIQKDGNGSVSIGGGAAINFSNSGTIEHQGGTFGIDPATVSFVNTGGIAVSPAAAFTAGVIGGNTGTINVSAGGTLTVDRLSQSSLTVNGLATLRPNGTPANMSRLTQLSVGGTFDLNDNDLLIDYPVGGPSPLNAVRTAIRSARANGSWTGPGITSTAAKNATPQVRTLGVMEASTFHAINGAGALFNGQPVDDSSVLVKFTYYGDSDFNGRINFDDYSRIDTGFLNGLSGWEHGDSNLDGVVNFDDYSLIDQAFLGQAGPPLRPTR